MSGTIKRRIERLNKNIRMAQEPVSESDEMHSLPFYEKGTGRTGGSRRPVKGSPQAKAKMARIRAMKGGSVVSGINCYEGNGVVSRLNSYEGNGVVSRLNAYEGNGGLKHGYRKHPVGHITEHHSMHPHHMRMHPDRKHHEQLAHEMMMEGGFPFGAIASFLGPILVPMIADKIGQLIHRK